MPLSWVKNDKGFMLDGRNIDVQATGVRARGGFRHLQPQGDEPWLGILAGISTNDGGQHGAIFQKPGWAKSWWIISAAR